MRMYVYVRPMNMETEEETSFRISCHRRRSFRGRPPMTLNDDHHGFDGLFGAARYRKTRGGFLPGRGLLTPEPAAKTAGKGAIKWALWTEQTIIDYKL
ncbi:hypothetical protein Zmor_025763 [Zophobas morio]|uniref:Uncharacterized protein n=1 Tax=Zophobas morio TaxID=2755281 RepID=A0AA38M405_9CUCU|nr:hypothetical protein Zmor_025763 [Zophobas morio]